jgi:two-component system, chemotaxis family, protein-glutamate methylesterase/glutaminase
MRKRRSIGGSDDLPSAIRSGTVVRKWEGFERRAEPRKPAGRRIEIIVVGCSLGGMNALTKIFSTLSDDFCIPIAVVQHRHKASDESLPEYFRRESHLCVTDVEDKQPIEPGCIYLAPANYHLLVERGVFSLSVDAAVAYSRPSIDVLFESAADAYREGVAGVVLTGANADGARGAQKIKRRGGMVIVQDPATAEAPAMPQAVIDSARVDRILPLDRIGPFLVELCRSSAVVKSGHA